MSVLLWGGGSQTNVSAGRGWVLLPGSGFGHGCGSATWGREAKAAPKVEGEDERLTAEVRSSECFGKGMGGCKEEAGSFCAVKPDPWCCLHGCVNQFPFTARPRSRSCLPHTSNGTCGKSARDPTGVCVCMCVCGGGGGTRQLSAPLEVPLSERGISSGSANPGQPSCSPSARIHLLLLLLLLSGEYK